jgi:hypothetical protein
MTHIFNTHDHNYALSKAQRLAGAAEQLPVPGPLRVLRGELGVIVGALSESIKAKNLLAYLMNAWLDAENEAELRCLQAHELIRHQGAVALRNALKQLQQPRVT